MVPRLGLEPRTYPLRAECSEPTELTQQNLWWARRDSNPEPANYELGALTIELQAHKVKWWR
jgi:hypothetical protein